MWNSLRKGVFETHTRVVIKWVAAAIRASNYRANGDIEQGRSKPAIAFRCGRRSCFAPHDGRALGDRVHGLEIERALNWEATGNRGDVRKQADRELFALRDNSKSRKELAMPEDTAAHGKEGPFVPGGSVGYIVERCPNCDDVCNHCGCPEYTYRVCSPLLESLIRESVWRHNAQRLVRRGIDAAVFCCW